MHGIAHTERSHSTQIWASEFSPLLVADDGDENGEWQAQGAFIYMPQEVQGHFN